MTPSTRSTFAQFGSDRPLLAVRAASFYTAIGLPMVYLPMIASGVTAENVPLVAALLVANALALIAGHGYDG